MKLFVWYPGGHLAYTYSVMAESEEEARAAVDKFVAEAVAKGDTDARAWDSSKPWTYMGKEYYELRVYERGQVAVESC